MPLSKEIARQLAQQVRGYAALSRIERANVCRLIAYGATVTEAGKLVLTPLQRAFRKVEQKKYETLTPRERKLWRDYKTKVAGGRKKRRKYNREYKRGQRSAPQAYAREMVAQGRPWWGISYYSSQPRSVQRTAIALARGGAEIMREGELALTREQMEAARREMENEFREREEVNKLPALQAKLREIASGLRSTHRKTVIARHGGARMLTFDEVAEKRRISKVTAVSYWHRARKNNPAIAALIDEIERIRRIKERRQKRND